MIKLARTNSSLFAKICSRMNFQYNRNKFNIVDRCLHPLPVSRFTKVLVVRSGCNRGCSPMHFKCVPTDDANLLNTNHWTLCFLKSHFCPRVNWKGQRYKDAANNTYLLNTVPSIHSEQSRLFVVAQWTERHLPLC